jgi:hypothetical protein
VQNTEVIDEHRTGAVACCDNSKRAIEHLCPAIVSPALLPSRLQQDRRTDALDQRSGRRVETAVMRQLQHMDAIKHLATRLKDARASLARKIASHQNGERPSIDTHNQAAVVRIERRIIRLRMKD